MIWCKQMSDDVSLAVDGGVVTTRLSWERPSHRYRTSLQHHGTPGYTYQHYTTSINSPRTIIAITVIPSLASIQINLF